MKTYSCRARGWCDGAKFAVAAFRFMHDEDAPGARLAVDVGAGAVRKVFPDAKFTFLSVVPVKDKKKNGS